MIRRIVLGLLVAVTPAALAAQQQPAPAVPAPAPAAQAPAAQGRPQQPSFRAGIDIVSLNVTVTDSQGHYATDLEQPEFSVFEDGVKQEISFFTRRQQPIALSLLLDSSASMEDKIATLQTAATSFVRRLKPNDLGQVIDFDTRAEMRQDFTTNHSLLETAIQQTAAGGSTALYNAIYIALKELKKIRVRNADEVRREAIVVLSDGEDTSSLVSFDEVLDLAKRSETAIYAIGLRGRGPDHARGSFNEADFVLRELSQQTGGRVFFAQNANELAGIYGQLSDELSSQYMLGYSSSNPKRDGAWRRVLVRVGEPNTIARTKQGYYAPTS